MIKPGCYVFFAGSGSLPKTKLPRTLKVLFNPRELKDPLTVLPGVGPATAREAARLGLTTLNDLLFHFPHRHEDFTSQKKISELKWGEEATVYCVLESISLQRTRRRNLNLVKAVVRDESGCMQAIWFNQDYLLDLLKPGDELLLRGVYNGINNSFRIKSHEVLGRERAGLHTTGFVPIYHTTEKISVKRIRSWLGRVRRLGALLADPLPSALRAELMLALKADAVLTMHFPHSLRDYQKAERRLIFDELFLMQVGLLSRRRLLASRRRAIKLDRAGELTRRFIRALPFKLTDDQKRVCREISADLQRQEPMQRLLQGDVGAGKTVVAIYTMLRAVEAGKQAALMAPTEVLAEQHFLNLQEMLSGLTVRTAFLSSRLKPTERQLLLKQIARGEVDIIVGTHALIQEDVTFPHLTVVVVDEQHRFGVRQREELTEKASCGGITPHVLHMTATPIPRTLALTLYGDLEISIIKSLPMGRRKVKTWLVPEAKRPGAYDFIRKQLDAGRQCYVVCPLIEESEALEAKAVETEVERLKTGEFSGYRLGALHSQMPSPQKQEIMKRFAAGEIQVLVTTTVIEVGVDVPNATVMMIEEADRFGLTQLHQLRGRVGRGKSQSYCLLFGDPKTEQAQRRLHAMTSTTDGFTLADLDLEIRGEGQLFGVRQSGLPDLKLARLTRDQEILKIAREKAYQIVEADPHLSRPENILLREEVERAFGEAVAWLEKI
jgi:ATP-dependent DNA helicase RecG